MWSVSPLIIAILFLYLYVFQDYQESLADPISLMPTVPPHILPPTPSIKIPSSMQQLMPAGVTFSTPFPHNNPVGKLA
jgi:hypothetical protein